jgi:hypothetical protein
MLRQCGGRNRCPYTDQSGTSKWGEVCPHSDGPETFTVHAFILRADTAELVYQRAPLEGTNDILIGRYVRFGSKADISPPLQFAKHSTLPGCIIQSAVSGWALFI